MLALDVKSKKKSLDISRGFTELSQHSCLGTGLVNAILIKNIMCTSESDVVVWWIVSLVTCFPKSLRLSTLDILFYMSIDVISILSMISNIIFFPISYFEKSFF